MATLAARTTLLSVFVFFALSGSAFAQVHRGLPPPDRPIDRSTPRRTVELFLSAARDGDLLRAAHALDLRRIAPRERAETGSRLARQLKAVLDRRIWVDLDALPDEPDGSAEGEVRVVTLGNVPLGSVDVPVTVVRTSNGEGERLWLVSAETLARVPALYDVYGPSFIESRLPPVLTEVRFGDVALWQALGLLLAVPIAAILGLLLASIVLRLSARFASRTRVEWDDRVIALARGPVRLFAALVLMRALLEPLRLALSVERGVAKLVQMGMIYAVAWGLLRLVRFAAEMIEAQAERMTTDAEGELRARGVRTQVRVFRRITGIAIGVLGAALMLLQFDVVRNVGMSLLASAGIAGIVIGLAAQRSIATLLAGIQLSLTQPIRIGDTVVVEGEWGTIEEINLTYVVVRVWDLRRLVVPMSKFLEQSFQNWTKVAPELLGTVFIYADYRLPVDAMRAELDRLLDGNPLWDGVAKGIVVTNCTERTIELRPLVSAKNASDLWQLRCAIREQLIRWLNEHEGGRYLPRTRLEIGDGMRSLRNERRNDELAMPSSVAE